MFGTDQKAMVETVLIRLKQSNTVVSYETKNVDKELISYSIVFNTVYGVYLFGAEQASTRSVNNLKFL